jgi:hypothetical protein
VAAAASADASEAGAALSATSAATSASAANADALLAKDWAIKLGSAVEGSEFSSKHHAQQSSASATASANSASAASTSATNAANSATASANSAAASTTSATNAANSVTAASSSASSASTSATNAATSATNAANSASAASTSATNAANSATSASNSASAASTSATNAANSASGAATSATNAANSATSAASSAAAAATFDPANFVNLTTNQTVGGVKTFSSNPLSSAAQSTATNSLTRRDFVTGLDGANVKLTGNQTIAGTKTFSSPVAGDITGNAATVTNGVYTTSDQTITGVKTFSSSPVVPNATTATQALSFGQVSTANATPVKTALNASGDAPIYACRAWVNFDGTTAPGTIRASGNVSSVTKNGTGDYTVNFTTAMPDANYSLGGSVKGNSTTNYAVVQIASTDPSSASSVRIHTFAQSSGSPVLADRAIVDVSIFR